MELISRSSLVEFRAEAFLFFLRRLAKRDEGKEEKWKKDFQLLLTKEIAVLSTIAARNALENMRLADRIYDITGEF